jgi:hypothetical protein
MTIHETEMATVATQRIPRPRPSTWSIGMLVVAGAGLVALTMQVVTSGTEPAERTATASFSIEAAEQSRTLNGLATSSTAAPSTLSLDGVLDARALNEAEAAESFAAGRTGARLASEIAHVRALNEYAVAASSSSLQAIADARALNEAGLVTGPQICTLPTLDDC